MAVASYLLFALAFASYFALVKAILGLVADSKKMGSGVSFNRFWWLPSWKVHLTAFPGSCLRRRIVFLYCLTFL